MDRRGYKGRDQSGHGRAAPKQKTYHQDESEDMDSEPSETPMHMQRHIQRSAEASKQMLYGTYGNVIAILEEFERREMQRLELDTRDMKKSNIPIPDQSNKDFDDIEGIVTTQLLLFQTQTKACPAEVLAELKDELKRRTIGWAAARAEIGIQNIHKTDHYISKLYEILSRGSTQHDIPESEGFTQETMKETFPHIMKGMHDKNMMDEEFKKDRNKVAVPPDMRAGDSLEDGAQRIAIAGGKKNFGPELHKDVLKLQQTGKLNLK